MEGFKVQGFGWAQGGLRVIKVDSGRVENPLDYEPWLRVMNLLNGLRVMNLLNGLRVTNLFEDGNDVLVREAQHLAFTCP